MKQHPDGSRPAGTAGRHHSWPLGALLAVGGWLVVSPLVLSTTRVTAGVVSAVAGGLAVARCSASRSSLATSSSTTRWVASA